jgi:hypothetical protein
MDVLMLPLALYLYGSKGDSTLFQDRRSEEISFDIQRRSWLHCELERAARDSWILYLGACWEAAILAIDK